MGGGDAKAIFVRELSPDMAQAVLAMLNTVAVPFAGIEKVLEIRLSLEALAQGRHSVVINEEKSD